MKLTQRQINKIKVLRKKGISTYKIAKRFNINESTVRYHTDEKQRLRVSYKMRREYFRNYRRKRYHEDKKFREEQQKRAREFRIKQKEVK